MYLTRTLESWFIRHFSVLANLKMPVRPGAVICLATQSLPLGPAVCSVPVAFL